MAIDLVCSTDSHLGDVGCGRDKRPSPTTQPASKMKTLVTLVLLAVMFSYAHGQTLAQPPASSGSGGGFASTGVGTGYQDVTEIAAPANPAAGVERLYSNSTTHVLACLTSGGASCLSGSGTVSANNTAAGCVATYAAAGGSPPGALPGPDHGSGRNCAGSYEEGVAPLTRGCSAQSWDANSSESCAWKFRVIWSSVLPIGGPEGLNSQAHSEQPHPITLCSLIHTVLRDELSWPGVGI
jgi:hypothetical protein